MPNERLEKMVTKINQFKDELDPEIIKIRDKIIAKIGNKPLDEVNEIIKKLLSDHMDENTRLGVLAARLKIIRQKIETLYENKSQTKTSINITSTRTISEEPKEKKEIKKEEEWIRVKLLEACEIEGKSIDKDVILDVKKSDGEKLISSKKAEELKNKEESKPSSKPVLKVEEEQSNTKKDIMSKEIELESENNKDSKIKQDASQTVKEKDTNVKNLENIQENLEKNNPTSSTVIEEKNNEENIIKKIEQKESKTIDEPKKDKTDDMKVVQDEKEKKDLLKQHEEKATKKNTEEK